MTAASQRSFAPANGPGGGIRPIRTSKARWAKPLPKRHKNFIPPPSWFGYQWIDKDP